MQTLKRYALRALLFLTCALPFSFAQAQVSIGNFERTQLAPMKRTLPLSYGTDDGMGGLITPQNRGLYGAKKRQYLPQLPQRQQPLNSTVLKNTTIVGSNGNTVDGVHFNNSPTFNLNVRGVSYPSGQNGAYQNSVLGTAPAATPMQTSMQPTAVSSGPTTSSVDGQLAVVNAQIEGQRQLAKEQRRCGKYSTGFGLLGAAVGGYFGGTAGAGVGTGVGSLVGQEFCD